MITFKDTGERKFWEDVVARLAATSFSTPLDPMVHDVKEIMANMAKNVPAIADVMLEEKRKRDPQGGTKG